MSQCVLGDLSLKGSITESRNMRASCSIHHSWCGTSESEALLHRDGLVWFGQGFFQTENWTDDSVQRFRQTENRTIGSVQNGLVLVLKVFKPEPDLFFSFFYLYRFLNPNLYPTYIPTDTDTVL